ncbi:hypothetical protein IC757_03215 [Wenzhouxiangella sp. AB-CW3]|uniref:hypothetical protein n=1 Tax=Wenzhouxiangella sp. AB-CW3 TaxID=2771012 RepID=UPI00168C0EC9|nr:hypothetical protein [Wenzhouxiangella sp. AB-CW3]QOC23181.1 hypothetical protein IC757_03215 [Wenzhouxiangella sp. AB-CW3]
MMHKLTFSTLLFLMLAACASQPTTHAADLSGTVDQSYDEVWERLVVHLSGTDFRIKSIARDSGVIFAERARFEDSLADCGSRGLASSSGRNVAFNVFVSESGGTTRVEVKADFTESRHLDKSRWTTECSSTGELERSIIQAIKA